MSQVTTFFNGGGSGTVASVTGGNGINITGNPSLNPVVNITAPVSIANGGTNAITMVNTDGIVYFDGTRLVTTTVGTSGQILVSNGAGMAPTFQSFAPGGVVSVNAGHDIFISGTATNPIVNVTNAITLGDLSSIIGSPAVTATTGDVTLVAGNINLPATNTAANEGIIKFNGDRFIHQYGIDNTFVGRLAGNTTLTTASAFDNTGIGDGAAISLTTGDQNTFGGSASGATITTGSNNAFWGFSTGYDINTDTGITTGSQNTFVGSLAGTNLKTNASSNILIGYNAGDNYSGSESSNILINSAGTSLEGNTIRIGTQANQTRCFVAGIVGVTTSNSEMVTINSTNGQLGVAAIPSGGAATFHTESGDATVSAGAITITGGLNINTSGSTSVVTVADSPDQYLTSYRVANASPFVVNATDFYITVDTSTTPITVQLPNAPTIYRRFVVKDSAGNASAQNITVTTVSGVKLLDGAATFVMNTNYQAAEFVYDNVGYQIF